MAVPAQDIFRAKALTNQYGYQAVEITKTDGQKVDIFPMLKSMGLITLYSSDQFSPDMVFNTMVGGVVGNKVAKLNFDVKVLEDKTADTIAELNVVDFNRQKLRHYETFIYAQRFRKTTFKYTIEDMIDGQKTFGRSIPSVLLGRLINQRRRDKEKYTFEVILETMKHFHTTGISIWDIGVDGKVVKDGGNLQVGNPATPPHPAFVAGEIIPEGTIATQAILTGIGVAGGHPPFNIGDALPSGIEANADIALEDAIDASSDYKPATTGNGIWKTKQLTGQNTDTLYNFYGQPKKMMKRIQTWPTYTPGETDRTLSEKFALLGDMDVYLSKIGVLTSAEYGNIHLEGLPKNNVLTVMPQTVLNELAVNGARMINSLAQRDMQTGEILQGKILGSGYIVSNNLPMIDINFDDNNPNWKTIKVLKIMTGEFAPLVYMSNTAFDGVADYPDYSKESVLTHRIMEAANEFAITFVKEYSHLIMVAVGDGDYSQAEMTT